MNNRALIGYTGFVGHHLHQQMSFDFLFNSQNIDRLNEQQYAEVVCAGAPGHKMVANQNPEEDRQSIEHLIENLKSLKTERFVLISTVDVFDNVWGMDEESSTIEDDLSPYGKHRWKLEKFVLKHFENVLIVRLPGLFAEGLKKNVIHDFLNRAYLERIHSQSTYQFYNLEHLSNDIQIAQQHNLRCVHLVSEPIRVHELAAKCFDLDFDNMPDIPKAQYDIRTVHASAFNKSGNYLYSKAEVFSELRTFVSLSGFFSAGRAQANKL